MFTELHWLWALLSLIFNFSNYFKSWSHDHPLFSVWRGFSWDLHGVVLQHILFQQKLYISFLAKRKDGRSKQNLQTTEFFLLQ